MPPITRRTFLKGTLAQVVLLLLPAGLRPQTANPPTGRFRSSATAEEVTHGLDLTGKHILVTGVNSGLGFETMRVLALRGAHVLGAARTAAKARRAAARVKGRVTPLVCDLGNFESVVACTKSIPGGVPHLDAVVCNAGIMSLPKLEKAEGLEKQFVVNYLGHFLLVQRLMPRLEAAPQGRIVMVSSGYFTRAPEQGIDFDNLAGEKSYEPLTAYGRSKLAQALYVREFFHRNPDSRVTANALHPGVIWTNLGRHLPWYLHVGAFLLGWAFMKSIPEGAATQCYVATHPSLAKVSGHFFNNCNAVKPRSAHFENRALLRKLWDTPMKLTEKHRT